MAKKKVRNSGRPSIYSKALASRICARIASGESLRSVCRDPRMPVMSTVLKWVTEEDKKSFSEQYRAACDIRAEVMYEELLDIVDDDSRDSVMIYGTDSKTEKSDTDEEDDEEKVAVIFKPNPAAVQRSRLRFDARRWYLSKLMPKKFGEKVDVTSGDEPLKNNTIVANGIVFSSFDNGTQASSK